MFDISPLIPRMTRGSAPDPDALLAAVGGRADAAALLVLALAPHLRRPVDPGRALMLLTARDAPDTVALGPAVDRLAGDARHRDTGAARLARAARLLAAQLDRNGMDPRRWTRDDIRCLFDPAGLRLACGHDPLLADLADRVTREAMARLGDAGMDPALLGLGWLGVGRTGGRLSASRP